MSDTSQGPGWWQASDGKWYPPEQNPGAAPTAPPPAGPPPGYAPSGPPPAGPPAGYASYGAPGAPGGAPGGLVEWPQRVAATLIDGVLLLPIYIVGFILAAITSAAVLFLFYLIAIAGSLYFAYLTGETGQSPGKRLMGIKVVQESNGQVIGGGAGVARAFIHIVDSICLIGYLSPLWDAKKQTFTDKIQNTIVIPGEKKSFSADLFKA